MTEHERLLLKRERLQLTFWAVRQVLALVILAALTVSLAVELAAGHLSIGTGFRLLGW